MSTTSSIKRAGPARKRPAVKAKSRRTSPKQQSVWSQAVDASPFSQATIDRAITLAMLGLFAVALIAVAIFAGVPGFVGTQIATVAGQAGFAVKRVEVNGINRMERLTVYAIALDQHSMAMPLVDLDKVRNQLMGYGWIKDARVYRRLPDTLVVDIVERKPAAVWQHNQKLSLIDESGVVLEPVSLSAMPALPLVIGKDANAHAVELSALINRAPSLHPQIASATWVGSRRWDIMFQSGEVLALPEGEDAAGKAFLRFARIDGVQRLLGGRYVRFDMRDPTKFVARIRTAQQAGSDTKVESESHGPA
ncbi:MAG: cell division protein FtsQ/DivIB [Sphingomonadaceae bacterium]